MKTTQVRLARMCAKVKGVVAVLSVVFAFGCMDSDETKSARYNFASFSGTEWATKVEIAVAEINQGSRQIYLIAPDSFDTNHPDYRPIAGCTVKAVLPVGSRIRIARLMQDNCDWGGVRVTATLEDNRWRGKKIYVERGLLAKNTFLCSGWTDSTNWDVNTNFLGKP